MSTPKADDRDLRPYFTVTNEYPRHRKIRGLSDRAFRLHITLMAICNEDRNDGILGKHDLHMFGPKPGKELLDAGLVHEKGHEYVMHDYLDHQKSSKQIEEHLKKKAESGALGGRVGMHKRWHVDRGEFNPDCPLCVELPQEA